MSEYINVELVSFQQNPSKHIYEMDEMTNKVRTKE